MIQAAIKLSGGIGGLSDPRVSVNNDDFLTLGQERMQEIGEFAIRTVKDRVAQGIGSDDAPMPPLKVSRRAGIDVNIHGKQRTIRSYAQWKSAHGLKPIRDLMGAGADGGNMLDNLSVRTVSGSSATISLTARKARAKALANERRAPWLSFSDSDQKAIAAFAGKAFGVVVEIAAASIRRAWRGRRAA
jgi:hypothetical protein